MTIQEQLRGLGIEMRDQGSEGAQADYDLCHATADRIDTLEAALRGLATYPPQVLAERTEYGLGYDSAREDVAAIAREALGAAAKEATDA